LVYLGNCFHHTVILFRLLDFMQVLKSSGFLYAFAVGFW